MLPIMQHASENYISILYSRKGLKRIIAAQTWKHVRPHTFGKSIPTNFQLILIRKLTIRVFARCDFKQIAQKQLMRCCHLFFTSQVWGLGWGARGACPNGPALGHACPPWPPTKAGQATMYVGSPPCMGFPPCLGSPACIRFPGIQVPHHGFHGIQGID